ncbi:MAG TPA: ABC transporter substrate-binding protein [Thermoleophilia bacterium]
MPESPDATRHNNDESGLLKGKSVSRREFLKIAGIAGATVGMGAGLGGLVAACGGTTTATTAATTATTSGPATTAGAGTTVSSGATTGREIKLGFVTPLTGGLASFGIPDKYCVDRWKQAIGTGMVLGDGQNHPISVTVSDSQSDSNRAAQVAGDLINNTKVDMMMVASTPDTVTPVVEQCEANGTPVVSTDCPWQTYLGQNKVYKWSYHVFFGAEDWIGENWAIFEKLTTNKSVGAMFDNTADGNFFSSVVPAYLTGKGYKVTDPGRFQPGTEDFTKQITAFKSAGCELITGNMIPPDFTNFWKQAAQQGLSVKGCMVGKAILFPQSVEALSTIGNGLLTELWWHRTFPFKSSLSGETCAQLAEDFEAKSGQQQTAPLLHYVIGEMAIWSLKNAKDPTSKDSIIQTAASMKFDSIVGSIDFTAPIIAATGTGPADWPVGPGHKTKNVYDHGLGGAQWLMKGGKFTFDEVPVDNYAAPYLTADLLTAPLPLPIK